MTHLEFEIRLMQSCDLDTILAWRNDIRVRQYMLTQHIISLEEHEDWFNSVRDVAGRYFLTYEEHGKPVGHVNFSAVANSTAYDWGFYTAPNAPKGTGQRLGKAALNYIFQFSNAHKICGQVLSSNQRSCRFHERIGFTSEGILKSQHIISGQWNDMVLYGLMKSDWVTRG